MGKLTREILAETHRVQLPEPYAETYLEVKRLEVSEYLRLKAEAREFLGGLIGTQTDSESGALNIAETVGDWFEEAARFGKRILSKAAVGVGGTDLELEELLLELEREPETLIGLAWQALGVNELTEGSKKNLLGLLASLSGRREERKRNEESASAKDIVTAENPTMITTAPPVASPASPSNGNAAIPIAENTAHSLAAAPENTTT